MCKYLKDDMFAEKTADCYIIHRSLYCEKHDLKFDKLSTAVATCLACPNLQQLLNGE